MRLKKMSILLLSLAFVSSCSSAPENNETGGNGEENIPQQNNGEQNNQTDGKDPEWDSLEGVPYETLLKLATPSTEVAKNYEVTLTDISSNFHFTDRDITLLNSSRFPSQLAYSVVPKRTEDDIQYYSFRIHNYMTSDVIDTIGEFTNINNYNVPVTLSSTVPLATFSYLDDVNPYVSYYDLAGNPIRTNLSISASYSYRNRYENGENVYYVQITDLDSNYYYKTVLENGLYTFVTSTWEEYSEANNPVTTSSDTQDLVDLHINSNWKMSISNSTYYFFDENGNYLQSIDLDLLRGNSNATPVMIPTDSAMYFYSYNTKEDVLTNTTTYEPFVYAIDLTTAEIHYTSDINYVIESVKYFNENLSNEQYVYNGGLATVKFVKKDGTLTTRDYVVDLSVSPTFDTYYDYDPLLDASALYLIDDKLVVELNDKYYVVDSDRKTNLLDDVQSINYLDSENVIFQTTNNKFAIVPQDEFVRETGLYVEYDYITNSIINDKHFAYSLNAFDEAVINDTEKTEISIDYLSFAENYLIFEDNFYGEGQFKISAYNSEVLTYRCDEVNYIRSAGQPTLDTTLYEVNFNLNDRTYTQYFALKNTEVK